MNRITYVGISKALADQHCHYFSRSTCKHTEAYKKHTKVHESIQKHTKVHESIQKHNKATKNAQNQASQAQPIIIEQHDLKRVAPQPVASQGPTKHVIPRAAAVLQGPSIHCIPMAAAASLSCSFTILTARAVVQTAC